MEIPVISRIIGFEAEINHRLQNPTFISRILVGIENEFSRIYSFWTLGALILAFLATFTRFNRVIFRFRRIRTVTSQSSFSKTVHDDDDDDDDEDTDEDEDDITSCSSSSTTTYVSEDEEYKGDEEFRVAGSGNYEEDEGHYFNWSDFTSGRNVVKSWRPDGLGLSLGLGLGLGLGLEDSSGLSGNLVSMWDNNNSNSSFLGQIPAVTSMLSSPADIMSAGLENSRNVALRVWDTRVGRHIPEIFAEWQPRWKKIAAGIDSGASGLNHKYSVDVRDIRNVKSPVEGLTESDVLLNKNTRWINGGSDGNNREVGCFNNKDELFLSGNDSVLSRYLSYLFCP